MANALYERFHQVTGYNMSDIARKVGITRQGISILLKTYAQSKAITRHFVKVLDDEIKTHQDRIKELETFKEEVKVWRE